MGRAIVGILLCLIAGCGESPHRQGIRKQVANMNELADLLAGVRDEPSMVEVQERIEERTASFQIAADAMRRLPSPELDQMERLATEFAGPMQAAFDRMTKECARIRNLPGGPKFVDDVQKLLPGKQGGTP